MVDLPRRSSTGERLADDRGEMPHVSRDYPTQDGGHDRVANDEPLRRLPHAEAAVPRDRDQNCDHAGLTVLPQPCDRYLSGDRGEGAAIAHATESVTGNARSAMPG